MRFQFRGQTANLRNQSGPHAPPAIATAIPVSDRDRHRRTDGISRWRASTDQGTGGTVPAFHSAAAGTTQRFFPSRQWPTFYRQYCRRVKVFRRLKLINNLRDNLNLVQLLMS